MSISEESQPAPPQENHEQQEDQRLALRRISQRLKVLQAELDGLNQGRHKEERG